MFNPVVLHDAEAERRQPPIIAVASDNDRLDLSEYGKILYANLWLIISIVVLSLILSGIYLISAKKMYEANFLIHVEEDVKRDAKTVFSEMGTMFDMRTTASAEIELVKSRMVISRALEKLDIYVSAQPEYLPVIGEWLAAWNKQSPIRSGLGGYAWGDEKIEMVNFKVPDVLLNKEFTITAGENGQFNIKDKTGLISADGKVGVPLKIDYLASSVEVLVGALQSKPNVRFKLKRISKLAFTEAVQANLNISEQGRQSAVIKVALRGTNPKVVNAVLSEIARQYVDQNAKRKMQEANNALAFLNKQLPELRQQLEESETKYNKYRNSKGTVDLAEEAKSDLQQLALAKTRKSELEQKRIELLVRFTPNHPVIIGADVQLRDINNEIQKLNAHIKSVPIMEQELLKLSREMKINTELYTSLLNTARQLKLVTIASTTNVRLVDMPMEPEKSVSTGSVSIMATGLLGGLIAGVAAAFMRSSLKRGIEDSAEIEQAINLSVFASIPQSATQKKLDGHTGAHLRRIPLLARDAPLDKTIESLRNLRAILQFSISHMKNNITLIISPTMGNGKSFISANLAVLMGASNKRVLLIDGDLRNGDLHRYFGVEQPLGLSEALAGTAKIDSYIHRAVSPNVDFISAGGVTSNPELLQRPELEPLLRSVAVQYDIVLINGAPLLDVADSLVIGAHVGAIFVVARAGVSTVEEIMDTVKTLWQAGLTARGCILNGVKPHSRKRYAYEYSGYQAQPRQYLAKNPTVIDVIPRSAHG